MEAGVGINGVIQEKRVPRVQQIADHVHLQHLGVVTDPVTMANPVLHVPVIVEDALRSIGAAMDLVTMGNRVLPAPMIAVHVLRHIGAAMDLATMGNPATHALVIADRVPTVAMVPVITERRVGLVGRIVGPVEYL